MLPSAIATVKRQDFAADGIVRFARAVGRIFRGNCGGPAGICRSARPARELLGRLPKCGSATGRILPVADPLISWERQGIAAGIRSRLL
jgi:hypothetical protein